jgi:hypothetical protein
MGDKMRVPEPYSEMFTPKQIEIIEQKYNGKYIFDSCIKNKHGDWLNFPVAIFYNPVKHPEGSNYFGIYRNSYEDIMICDGISATEEFNGLEIDGIVIYSHFRHDFREFSGVFIDGGRDYLRCGGERINEARLVKIKVIEDRLEIVNAVVS